MTIRTAPARAILGACLFVLLACAGPKDVSTLPVTEVVVESEKGPQHFTVELATDSASQERGLMYRKSLAPNAGMLFDFYYTMGLTFWMKNTYIPLDIIFIRADGTIANIAANAEPMSTKQIPSKGGVRAVLEINGGRAAELGIKSGQKVHAGIFGNL